MALKAAVLDRSGFPEAFFWGMQNVQIYLQNSSAIQLSDTLPYIQSSTDCDDTEFCTVFTSFIFDRPCRL